MYANQISITSTKSKVQFDALLSRINLKKQNGMFSGEMETVVDNLVNTLVFRFDCEMVTNGSLELIELNASIYELMNTLEFILYM